MGLLDAMVSGLFRKSAAIRDADGLAGFMDSRAAFLAQKCVVEFCRVRAGVYWQKLFSEAQFQEELTKSRWASYPPAYAMVAEMVECVLREPAGLCQRRLPQALETLSAGVFARYPVPEGAPADFWSDAQAMLRERLEATQAAAARPVRDMPDPLARVVFKALPLHPQIVMHDYDYIFNFLRMNLLRAHDDFIAAADGPAIVESLLDR